MIFPTDPSASGRRRRRRDALLRAEIGRRRRRRDNC